MRFVWLPLVAFTGCLSVDFVDGGGGNGGDAAGGGLPNGGGGAGGVGASGGNAQDGGGGGTGGAAVCDTGTTCVPIPDSAKKPFALVESESECSSDDVVTKAGLVSEDASPLSFEPASCGCQCVLPGPEACPDVNVEPFGNSDCTGLTSGDILVSVMDCVADFEVGHPLGSLDVSGVVPGTPTCSSDGVSPDFPPVDFTEPRYLCGGNLEECGDSSKCVPGDRTYCINGSSDAACPAEFPSSIVVVREADLSDTRDCECECGATTQSCSPFFQLFQAQDCSSSYGVSTVNDCTFPTAGGVVGSFRYAPVVQGSCTDNKNATGSVDYSPVTLCCRLPVD